MTLIEFNPRAVMGGNNPPPNDALVDARDTYKVVATWLRNNPAVTNESDAHAANEILGIAKSSLTILESARESECTPLRKIWEEARAKWATPIDSISKLHIEVSGRLQPYMLAEEDKRKAKAAEARRAAEALEAAAREAERIETEARDNASVGEFVDVVQASNDADQAFGEFKHAERIATIAEKGSTVKLRSRFATKATTLRTKRTLVIADVEKALTAVGITEGITEAILTEARKFKRDFGKWPDGVIEETERGL